MNDSRFSYLDYLSMDREALEDHAMAEICDCQYYGFDAKVAHLSSEQLANICLGRYDCEMCGRVGV